METYLVGGAVRDRLLGTDAKDRDYLVVGATVEQMVAVGFEQVGRDFPVFLHPRSKEEYALARTERKSGQGYAGFTCYAGKEVTLEEDLKRRDLTINAMALTAQGKLIDPYGGVRDLRNRVLRHVSQAFCEDPLRILRLARFYARYQPLGFSVAKETLSLVEQMVEQGQVEHLVQERIWQETFLVLAGDKPWLYFQMLHKTRVLNALFPLLDQQFGQKWNWAMASLKVAVKEEQDVVIRFVCIFFTGLICEPEKCRAAFFQNKKIPSIYADLLKLNLKAWPLYQKLLSSCEGEILLDLFYLLDLWRHPENLLKVVNCWHCLDPEAPLQRKLLETLSQAKEQVSNVVLSAEEKILPGKKIQQILYKKRLDAIKSSLLV